MSKTQDPTPYRASPSYPETHAEAEDMLRWSAIGGYSIESIGERINPPPKPLPESFLGQFAASVVRDPVSFGRVVAHALAALQAEKRGGA